MIIQNRQNLYKRLNVLLKSKKMIKYYFSWWIKQNTVSLIKSYGHLKC